MKPAPCLKRLPGAALLTLMSLPAAASMAASAAYAADAPQAAPARPAASSPQHKAPADAQARELAQARAATARGDLARALRIYQHQARLHPKDREIAAQLRRTRQLLTLQQAEQALQRGDDATALRLARGPLAKAPDPYRAGLIAAQALQHMHHLDEAGKVYAELAQRYPKDPELARQARLLQAEQQLDRAEAALKAGDAIATIRIAQPVYESRVDDYRAGWLLARALMANHWNDRALPVLRDLAARYPKDPEVAAQLHEVETGLQLDAAQRALDGGHPDEARRLAGPLLDDPGQGYRAGLLVARAWQADKRDDEAQKVYAKLAARYPADKELGTQASTLQRSLVLDRAEAALQAGDARGAIALARPVYDAGEDTYRAGWVLARAYQRDGQLQQSQQLYAQLAKRYPKDGELAVQPVLLLAQMHDAPRAHEAFVALPQAQQDEVVKALGAGTRWLYANSLTVGATLASSTRSLPGDNDLWLQYSHTGEPGTIVVGMDSANRFDQYAKAFSVDFFRPLANGWGMQLGTSFSPESSFLARSSYTVGVSRAVNGVTYDASVRQLNYTNSSATVLFGGVTWQATPALQMRTGLYFTPTTSAYAVLVAPSWTDSSGTTFASVTGGTEGDQIGVQGAVERIPTYTLRLGHTWPVRPDFSVTADAFHEHRAGLYDRTGVDLYLTRRW